MPRVFVLHFLLVYLSSSLISCHDEVNPLRYLRHERATVEIDENIKLQASPVTLSKSGEWVTISWSGVSNPSDQDWVGVWVLSGDDVSINAKTQAPVKFQYCNQSSTHKTNGYGEFHFYMVNMRGVNRFGLFRGGFDAPTMVAESNTVTFTNPNEPLHVHLALTNSITEMIVMWVTKHAKYPEVRWGNVSKQYTNKKLAISTTYQATDMCDSPAKDYGWLDPGMIHRVTLDGLNPATRYYYIVGDSDFGYSEEFSFMSAPVPGPDVTTRVLTFGDMGHGEFDDTQQVRKLEQASLNTTERLTKEIDTHHLILDVGDISYADGYEPIWDEYFDQVQTLLGALPCMVNPGNHESDSPNSDSYWKGHDSGGECNVPYVNRFAMPTPGPKQPWYGFDYGCIHVIMMSTEHDFRNTSVQYAFLKDHFKKVNRTTTPWLVFGGHRPMYIDSSDNTIPYGQNPVSQLLIQHIEPLLLENKVDIAFWGHHHSYQRMCQVAKSVCTEGAPQHIVIGMAGRALLQDLLPTPPSFVQKTDDQHWGYSRFTANATTLVFEYLHNDDGQVYDTMILRKMQANS